MRMRNRRFSLWLDDKEFDHLTKQSKIAGLKKEVFIRRLLNGECIRARPPDTYYKLWKEINAIGVNINQIAHIANYERTISEDKINYLTKLLDEIMNKVCELK